MSSSRMFSNDVNSFSVGEGVGEDEPLDVGDMIDGVDSSLPAPNSASLDLKLEPPPKLNSGAGRRASTGGNEWHLPELGLTIGVESSTDLILGVPGGVLFSAGSDKKSRSKYPRW